MSSIVTSDSLRRAAIIAPSLSRFAKSAPEQPGVILATVSKSTEGSSFIFAAWILRISSLPLTSGRSMTTCLSKRPGRKSALSSTSGRLVAAIIITPLCASKPSISTSSELRVCSLSSWPPPMPAPLWRPTASISSMKTRHGAVLRACSNMSRTRAAPTPTNISTKSEPLIE